MKYETLPQIESTFKTQSGSQLIPFSAPVPGENIALKGMVYVPPRTGYYYPTVHTKQRIVLHFTAGNVRSDIMSLTRQDYHVSVAFVIARDGTIYQLHPSKNWSGHLGAGIGNQGTGNREDKASIGIEISNYGPLIPRDGNLETVYSRLKNPNTGKTGPIDTYCTMAQKDAYIKLDSPFRGESYYASYTPEQLESTIILLRFLTAKYQIPRKFLPPEKRFTATNDVVTFKGIVTHINYRNSGKWDIGPAFDWDKLIAGVSATTPVSIPTTRIRSAKPGMKSKAINEAEIDVLFEKANAKIKKQESAPEEAEATDNEGYNPNDYDHATKKSSKAPASGNLFGLLIGINTYENFDNLSGCVNDTVKMEKYVKSRTEFKSNLLVLTNEAATKKAIVSAFKTHLSKAKENDTVLIFYSGHGTREDADPKWDESDATLECLVCQDLGLTKDSDYLMADKEQRYLINQLYQKTKAHIVLIFDCCHSGDNTRGAIQIAGEDKKAKKKFIVTSRPTGAFEKRPWSGFIFSKEIKQPTKNINIHHILPEGAYVSLSACEQDQSAIESGGEGIFTKYLMTILKNSSGNISYNNLGSQLTQVMRFTEEQTPKIYSPPQFGNTLDKGFLNSDINASGSGAEATFNEKKGWQINKGAIHNVHDATSVVIYAGGNRAKPVKAKVKSVFIDYAVVVPEKPLAEKKAHPADISDLLSRRLYLELDNWHGHPHDTKALVESIIQRAGGYYEIQGISKNTSREADYALSIRNGDVIITRPGDPFRPLVRPLPLVKSLDVKVIVDNLIHIAMWHFIKELRNTNKKSSFTDFPLSVNVSLKKAGKFQKLKIENNTVQLSLTENSDNEWTGQFKIELKNTTRKSLYVAALYLDKHFMSFPGLLPGKAYFLEKGASVFLESNKSDELNLELGEQEQQYNWPLMTEFIQIVVSEENFDITALALGELPAPYVLSDRNKAVKKGMITLAPPKEKRISLKRWQAQLLQLELKNPEYNIPDPEELKALLEYEETSMFAAGIWYDVRDDEFGEPTLLVLKEEMKLPPQKKGLVSNFKILLGNTIETMNRRKMYRRYKDSGRIRIVAEGDSWFQYPIILKDILDQLYKLYAIRSYSEAGDTLQNYMKKKEYLKGIAEEKPQFFLISGGGNDILGSEFKDFLNDKPKAAPDIPGMWLNQKFYDTIDQLQTWYIEMIDELLTKYPTLHIITHSYDYAIPVDTTAEPKTTSWLGKYMIKKGMKNQSDRKELIRYIVNQFNEKLQSALEPYSDNVSYIDLRGLVKDEAWHDEIHPTNEAFEIIADKFVSIIESKKEGAAVIEESAAPIESKQIKKLPKKITSKKPAAKKPAAKKKIKKPAFKRKAIKRAVRSKSMRPQGNLPEMSPPPSSVKLKSLKQANGAPHKPVVAKKKKAPVKSKSPFRPGQLDYNIPGTMKVGKTVLCKIRIGGKEVSKKEINTGPGSKNQEIKISNEMGVRLTDVSGGKHFRIVSASSEKQAIEFDGYSEWQFKVTPLKSKDSNYILALTITAYYDGKQKDYPILEKSISVQGETKRVVFMAADTRKDLNLEQEYKIIKSQLRKVKAKYHYTKVVMDLTAFKLMDVLLEEAPSILHYSGHSKLEGIYLFDREQRIVLVKEDNLRTLFENSKKKLNIECMVLNSCYSRGQATALQKFTKFMIGTTSAIANTDAIEFSKGFYANLFNNMGYKEAYDNALITLNISSDDSRRDDNYIFYQR